jgi:NAD(P)-dependent dehydrogenase (short-subunit alcohol dehydrogenase family)
VILLTKQMAIDYAKQGIRVNSICPGAMVEMIRDRRDRMDITARLQYAAKAEQRYPMGRYGEFEEVAQAALFLASAASSFMTGSALVIDGGFTAQ